MKKLSGTLVLLLCTQLIQAQETKVKENINEQTLKTFLKKGEINGHIRSYFMNTINKNGKDYYADAIGTQLKYETNSYKGFQVGISGTFVNKIFSSDLSNVDLQTRKSSKWEQELFDVNDKENYQNINRLDELYIKYNWKNNYIMYGKIPTEFTPLLNKSDGRMQAFAFQGGWFHHHSEENKWLVDVAWIRKVSPRSMTKWFSMDEAIGISDNGFQPNGKKAKYLNKTPTEGIGISHLERKNNHWKLNIWNFYLDKMMNSSWLQLEYSKQNWQLGGIYSYQIPLLYQKKLDYEERYIQPGENGQVLSVQGKYKHSYSEFRLAYSKAFDSGRYLFPKELGRDQFYTSMPRNRLEGLGNVQILSAGILHHWNNFTFNVDASSSFGAKVGNYQNNKYNTDDFYQINLKIHYELIHFLKGLNVDFLYIWKENKNNHQPELMYQKSDYSQLNLITNYNF